MTIIKLDKPALVLRTCDENLRSYYRPSFQWPAEGFVFAPDWDPSPHCGNGLHGLLWGAGGSSYLTFHETSKWMVVEVDEYVQATPDKVKFPKGRVVFVGTQSEATRFIYERAPAGTSVVGLTLTGGNRSTLTGGNRSTLTGGNRSTLTGGNRSTLTGGNDSTLTGGDDSTLTGGNDSTLTGGNRSTLTGGNRSTLTGGNRSTLTGGNDSTLTGGDDSTLTGGNDSTLTGGDDSTLTGGNDSTLTGGDDSTLTGGDDSTLTGGDDSTLTGGDDSTLTGGNRSTLIFKRYDHASRLYRRKLVEMGDEGTVAGKPYRMNDKGVIVPA